MRGKEGELFLAVNGFVLAYADKFTAVLTEHLKEMSFRGNSWFAPMRYEAKIMLSELSSRHDDVLRDVLAKTNRLDFVGYYKAKNGINFPIRFSRLVPINGELDDFLRGYLDEWEFAITAITDDTITEFKRAYG